jgi:hypothetical protein
MMKLLPRSLRQLLGLSMLFVALLLLAANSNRPISVLATSCPNQCSGHGSCQATTTITGGKGTNKQKVSTTTSDGTCVCHTGWSIAADCSMASCPTGNAFASKASALNTAHGPMECSNSGYCDRSSGVCTCFNGFTGDACDKLSCGDCSGHGYCDSTSSIYSTRYTGLPRSNNNINNYTIWDSEATAMCVCEVGYTVSFYCLSFIHFYLYIDLYICFSLLQNHEISHNNITHLFVLSFVSCLHSCIHNVFTK